jgi:hypothetical protein
VLDDRQVREIRALLRDPEIQVTDVARRYGVSRTTLYRYVGSSKSSCSGQPIPDSGVSSSTAAGGSPSLY